MPTILLKKSDTPGSVPGTANLTNLAGGVEVAVNTADKRVYSMTSASAVIELGTNPSSLTCADVSATVFRSASATITNLIATSASITTLTNNPTFGAGTANGVLYLNGSKVATSGSALVFDGTNLGVGTASPGSKLEISASNPVFTIYNTNTGDNGITWESDAAAGASRASLFLNYANAELRMTAGAGGGSYFQSFYTNGSERMRLTSSVLSTDSSINVGIGTASPGSVGVSGYTRLVLGAGSSATDGLTIVPSNTGGVQFTDAANVKKGYLQWDSSTGALALGTAGTTKATLDSSGNLGIGTTSPGTRLDVQSSTTGTRNARFIDNSGVGGGGRGSGIGLGGISNDTGPVISEYARLIGLKTNATQGNSQGYLSILTNDGSTLVERAVVDTSGNLGLGVTPNAWNAVYRAMNIGLRGFIFSRTDNQETSIGVNWYRTTGAAFVYAQNGYATSYTQLDGVHGWYNSTNNTSGANAPYTPIQAMTLDANTNLLCNGGTTGTLVSASRKGIEVNCAAGQESTFALNVNGALTAVAGIASASDFVVGSVANIPMIFRTNNTERARITAGGLFQLNQSADTNYLFSNAAAANLGGALVNASTAGYAGIQGIHSSNSATGYCAYFNNSGSATGLYISNTAAWQSTSDERLKTDIKDLDSTEKLMQLRPRDYLWKSQETSDTPDKRNFGFIAQEVQEVFPDLVGVSPDGMFSVEYTGLIAPLVKAVQELKAELDAAKVKIAALESK